MRSHNNEHSDALPCIDIASLRHVAYVFDALIYYMRSGTDTDTDVLRDGISVISWQDHEENENDDHDDDINNTMMVETDSVEGDGEVAGKIGRKHPFFQRSDSTLFLGCPPPDPFQTPLVQALPLADQPHLLQPNSRREDLFGVAKQTIHPHANIETRNVTGSDNTLDKLPLHLSLSVRVPETQAGPLGDSSTSDNLSGQSVIVRPGIYPSVPGADVNMGGFLPRFFPPLYDPEPFIPPPRIDSSSGLNLLARAQQSVSALPGQLPSSTPAERAEIHQASVIVHSSTAMSANVSTPNVTSASQSMSASSPVYVGQTQPSDLRATAVNIPLTSESVISSPALSARALAGAPIIAQQSGSQGVAMDTGAPSAAVIRHSPIKMRQSPGKSNFTSFLNSWCIKQAVLKKK